MRMPIDAQTIQAIGNLGAAPLLGILLWQAIKIRRNGNGRLGRLEEKVNALIVDIALIKIHLGIKKGGD